MDEQEAGTERSQAEAAADAVGESSASENSDEKEEAVPKQDERDPQEGRSGDALAWLEGPAFNAPIEEMPTLQWPDVEAEVESANSEPGDVAPDQAAGEIEGEVDKAEPPDDLAAAMLWLETLAEKQGTPIEETPTLVSGGKDESDLDGKGADVVTDEAGGTAAGAGKRQLGDAQPPPTLDSDPMAWLEQLAIDQDSPIEELPSVADRLLASEIVSQINGDANGEAPLDPLASQPLELDDALQYLESQAAAQGISLDEVTFDEAGAEAVDDDLADLDKLAIAPIAAAILENESESPMVESEPPAAATGPPATEAESPATESELPPAEAEAPLAVSEPAVAQGEEDEWDDLSAQIPEDPDAALAWLGELSDEEDSSESDRERSALKKGMAAAAAAKLAKSGDKKGSATEVAEETAATAAATADAEIVDADILDGMPDDPDEAMAWMVGLAAHEAASATEKASAEEASTEEASTEEASAEDASGKGALAEKVSTDVDEEEQPSGKMLDAKALEDKALEDSAPEDSAPEDSAPEDRGGEKNEGIKLARAALASGAVAKAAAEYRHMLDSGQGGPELIDELETAVAEHPDQPEMVQLLGDAYMENGQIQKALKIYSQGFDQL